MSAWQIGRRTGDPPGELHAAMRTHAACVPDCLQGGASFQGTVRHIEQLQDLQVCPELRVMRGTMQWHIGYSTYRSMMACAMHVHKVAPRVCVGTYVRAVATCTGRLGMPGVGPRAR